MKKPSVSSLLFGLLPLVLLATACSSTPHEHFTVNSFSNNSPYQRHVAVSATLACAAAERTLLGDGYSLDNTAKTDTVKGRKAYLMDSGRSSFLEMSVVCLPDATGSTIYANGLISQYDLKKSANAASVGVSVLGSISMPIGQSVDSMVKVSDETIRDRVFYKNFFSAIETVLNDPLLEAASPAVPIQPVPAPAILPSVNTKEVDLRPALSPPPAPPSPAAIAPATVPATPPTEPPLEPANPLLEKQFKGDKTPNEPLPTAVSAPSPLLKDQPTPPEVSAPAAAPFIEPATPTAPSPAAPLVPTPTTTP